MPDQTTDHAEPEACDIEIVELVDGPVRTDGARGFIAPNQIRINGRPVLAPADYPVVVHEMAIRSDDLVRVTLTVFARRVRISHEEKRNV